MLKKGEHIKGTPAELEKLLATDAAAKAFFDTLSTSYKQGYCDWVGSVKQEETRKVRAGKALLCCRISRKRLKRKYRK